MAAHMAEKTRLHSRLASKDAAEYRLLFAVCFPVFLVATIGTRLLGLGGERGIEPHSTIYSEKRHASMHQPGLPGLMGPHFQFRPDTLGEKSVVTASGHDDPRCAGRAR
jgi:hypothetical protein